MPACPLLYPTFFMPFCYCPCMNKMLIPLSAAGVVLSLACSGLVPEDNDCGALALSRDEVLQLLSAWEGRYSIAGYCPLGDCPPNPLHTTTMVVDPGRRVLEWAYDGSPFKSVDLEAVCISGLMSTAGTGFASATLLSGNVPSEDMVITLSRQAPPSTPDSFIAMINVTWPDPNVTQQGLTMEGIKMWSGSVSVVNGELVDTPPDTDGAPRSRALSASSRADIWLKSTFLPGAGRFDGGQ